MEKSTFLRKFEQKFRRWVLINHPELQKEQIENIISEMVLSCEIMFDEIALSTSPNYEFEYAA